jgi:RHS repeat-associated protein
MVSSLSDDGRWAHIGFDTNITSSPELPGQHVIRAREFKVADFDGDGRDDILILERDYDLGVYSGLPRDRLIAAVWLSRDQLATSSSDFVFESVKTTLYDVEEYLGNPASSLDAPSVELGDLDGDGRVDLVLSMPRLDVPCWQYPDVTCAADLHVFRQAGLANHHDLLVETRDGVGLEQHVTYDQHMPRGGADPDPTVTPAPFGTCAYPERCVTRGPSTVRSHTTHDPFSPDLDRTLEYRYEDRRVDMRGRGDLGFGKVTVQDAAIGRTVVTELDRSMAHRPGAVPLQNAYTCYPKLGRPTARTTFQSLDGGARSVTTVETFTYDAEISAATDRYSTVTTHVSSAVFEDGATQPTVSSTTVYDDLDPLRQPRRVTHSTAGGRETVVQRFFKLTPTKDWLIALVAGENVTDTTADAQVQSRSTTFDYDARGLLIWEEREPQGTASTNLLTTYQRTADGLVEKLTTTSPTELPRTEDLTYDVDGAFVTSIENAQGHFWQFEHSPVFGVIRAGDPNCVVTERGYDAVGRVVRESSSMGTWVDYTFEQGAHPYEEPSGIWRAFSVRTLSSDAPLQELRSYFDGRGRAKAHERRAIDGSVTRNYIVYDDAGRVTASSLPVAVGDPAKWISRTHDELGRLLTITHPGDQPSDQVDTFAYPSLLELGVTDRAGRRLKQTYDVDGQLVLAERFSAGPSPDALGQTTFQYGPFGVLKAVDDGLALRSVEHDALGRVVELLDPASGVHAYVHNAYGELTEHTTPGGNVRSYAYDTLGRLKWRITEDGSDSYGYDPVNGLGKLGGALSADGAFTILSYDAQSRVWRKRLMFDGSTHDVEWLYDGQSRVERIEYPQTAAYQLVVDHVYDGYGHLEQLVDAATSAPIWKAADRDRHGRVTRHSFGSTATVDRNFDEVFGKLLDLTATQLSGPSEVFNYEASLHRDGKLKTRNLGPNVKDTYDYDDLGRLQAWTSERFGTERARHYTFDKNQRLERVDDFALPDLQNPVASEEYHYQYDHPYRAGEAGSTALDYDDDGRQQRRVGPDLERYINVWSSFNLPKQGTVGIDNFAVAYDAFGGRVRKTVGEASTTYILGLLEIRGTGAGVNYAHMVFADGELVAQIEADIIGQTRRKYLLHDTTGSVVAALNEDGSLLQTFYYEPYGRRIDVNGAPVGLGGDAGITSGLTSHEHDLDLGLVNMNGRVYDPVTRGFLSSDPIAGGIHLGLALDGYRYVNHDPTNLSDPLGLEGEEGGPEINPECGCIDVYVTLDSRDDTLDQDPYDPGPLDDVGGYEGDWHTTDRGIFFVPTGNDGGFDYPANGPEYFPLEFPDLVRDEFGNTGSLRPWHRQPDEVEQFLAPYVGGAFIVVWALVPGSGTVEAVTATEVVAGSVLLAVGLDIIGVFGGKAFRAIDGVSDAMRIVNGAGNGGGGTVFLFHGSQTWTGTAFSLEKAIAGKRAFTSVPGIYLTDDALRAASQYGRAAPGGRGTVVVTEVSEAFAARNRRAGGPPAHLPEYFVNSAADVATLNQRMQIYETNQFLLSWRF